MEGATVIQYHKVRIGDARVLLPKTAEMGMVPFDGYRTRNVTEFSSCRACVSQSTFTFGGPAPAPAASRQEVTGCAR